MNRDIFCPNDYIGSCALDLSKLFKDAFENNRSITWDEKYNELVFDKDPNIKLKFDEETPEGKYRTKFWIPMRSKDRSNPDEFKEQGSILISVQLLTKTE